MNRLAVLQLLLALVMDAMVLMLSLLPVMLVVVLLPPPLLLLLPPTRALSCTSCFGIRPAAGNLCLC